jgi:hypothetical protein
MTIMNPPSYIQGKLHPAENVRLMTQGLRAGSTGLFPGGVDGIDNAHGVVNLGDFAVTAGAAWTVNIAAGAAFIRGTESAVQGAYHAYNDGTVNLAVPPADSANPQRHIIGIRVRDHNYGSAGSLAEAGVYLVVVSGTPAPVPADPVLPANFLPLARLQIPALAANAAAGTLTSLRRQLPTPPLVRTNAERLAMTNVAVGQRVWAYDTAREWVWDGTTWRSQNLIMLSWSGIVSGSAPGAVGTFPLLVAAGSAVFTTDGNGHGTINFGGTFPNGILTIQLTAGDATVGGTAVSVVSNTASSVVARVYGEISTAPFGVYVLNRWASSIVRVNFLAMGH